MNVQKALASSHPILKAIWECMLRHTYVNWYAGSWSHQEALVRGMGLMGSPTIHF